MYAVLIAGREEAMRQAAAPFGLVLDPARCQPLTTNLPSAGLPAVNRLSFCGVERTADGRTAQPVSGR